MVTIKVPATSANIGPGFDSLGIALNLYATYSFEELSTGLVIEGCEERFQNENNLIYVAYKLTMDYLKLPIKGLKLCVSTDVPVSRGLGSSATCVVGGILGANAIANYPLTKEEVLMLATKLEGHPDNVAPAIYGGLTASLMFNDQPYSIKYDISKELHFFAMIPDFETKTSDARKVLPTSVSYHDAIHNASHVAVLMKALETANSELIKLSLDDCLHEPYRKSLIKGYDEVKKNMSGK
ncbi:MAG: homoserine kinase [Erysipelotrichaceae bacterium]